MEARLVDADSKSPCSLRVGVQIFSVEPESEARPVESAPHLQLDLAALASDCSHIPAAGRANEIRHQVMVQPCSRLWCIPPP